MMAKVTDGEVSESTRVRLSLSLGDWVKILGIIVAVGGYLGRLQTQASRALDEIHERVEVDAIQTQRLDYHAAVLISKGLMRPEDLFNEAKP